VRKLLLIAILLTSFSCKKDSDPSPSKDLTTDLVGTYLYSYRKTALWGNVTLEYTIKWTISKAGENKIKLIHRRTKKIIPEHPSNQTFTPFEITIDDIDVARSNKFTVEKTADWITDFDILTPTRVTFDATLAGQKIDVKSKSTILSSNETIEDEAEFIKQ
jgi:hypothetical protein